jgi:hypothetical protein
MKTMLVPLGLQRNRNAKQLTDMNTNDTNVSSTSPEEGMSMNMPLSAAALGQLGLRSLDDQTDQALTIAMRRLSALDELEPDLGIRGQVQAALKAHDPVAAIGRVLTEYQDRLSE